jgi:hypothetical protein
MKSGTGCSYSSSFVYDRAPLATSRCASPQGASWDRDFSSISPGTKLKSLGLKILAYNAIRHIVSEILGNEEAVRLGLRLKCSMK